MRTLLIITNRYPADGVNSSIFVKNQVDALKKHFDRVIVLALSPLVPRLIARLPFMKPRWRWDSTVRDYSYDNVSVHFIKYFNLPLSFFKQRAGDACFDKVKQFLEKKKIDITIIHAHFTYPSGYVGAKLKEVSGKPLVITGHGYDVYALPFKSDSWKEKVMYALKNADRLITVSTANAKKMQEIGIPAEKISIIPNGFDSSIFKHVEMARERLKIPSDKKVLLSVGNLEKVKGHRYLIEAMELIHEKSPDILCYIVGDGPERKRLEKQIKNLSLEGVVKIVGARPHDEIPLWMNACDIYVQPSVSESFGVVLIEAMACAKPVVATEVGGIPEIITSEDYGLLVPPADPDALANALLKALELDWDGEYIIKYAKRYDIVNVANKVIEVYENVAREDGKVK